MRTFLRWWETLGRPERIVAMSLTAGGIVAIVNSTTWAVAVCYMTRQKAQVAMWKATRNPAAGAPVVGTSDADAEAHPMPGRHSDMPLPIA